MLPGHPYRVVVASLNICRWGVGCHAQTGRECQSYDPRDMVMSRSYWNLTTFTVYIEVFLLKIKAKPRNSEGDLLHSRALGI